MSIAHDIRWFKEITIAIVRHESRDSFEKKLHKLSFFAIAFSVFMLFIMWLFSAYKVPYQNIELKSFCSILLFAVGVFMRVWLASRIFKEKFGCQSLIIVFGIFLLLSSILFIKFASPDEFIPMVIGAVVWFAIACLSLANAQQFYRHSE